MESEQTVLLELNESIEVSYVENILSHNNNIQIEFKSFAIFEKCFYKFSELLYQYSSQVIGLYAPSDGNIFVDTVKILSTIEDFLEIPISLLTISVKHINDIKQIIEFYEADLNDGSLVICIAYTNMNENSMFFTPIEIISYIERTSNVCGIMLSIDLDEINHMLINQYLFEAYAPYLGAIYGVHSDIGDYHLINDKKYNVNFFYGHYIKKGITNAI